MDAWEDSRMCRVVNESVDVIGMREARRLFVIVSRNE